MILEMFGMEQGQGVIKCRSKFYSALTSFDFDAIMFKAGVNELVGEIDSDVWGISYLVSMYGKIPRESTVYMLPKVYCNGNLISFEELSRYAVYMDPLDPFFSKRKSVEKMANYYQKKYGTPYNVRDIFEELYISDHLSDCRIWQTGNEYFQAMTAIGLCADKHIFCFPWMSEQRLKYYQVRLEQVLKVLTARGKIVIFPCAKPGIVKCDFPSSEFESC